MQAAEKGAGTSAGAERRPATVLFADLRGYTEWTEQADPEDVAAVMHWVKREAVRIVEAHGGVVNQFVGDEVMALFGVPCAHEDDPRRAVAAALELHRSLAGADKSTLPMPPQPLCFHTGIATGLLLAQVEDVREGLVHVTGQSVNLAARLRGLASDDEILLCPETVRLCAASVRTEPLPAQRIKGLAQELAPHRVLGLRSLDPSFEAGGPSGLLRHVGRAAEVQRLRSHLARAAEGRGQLVSITGAAGLGKTRLLHELRRMAQQSGFQILSGRCQSYGDIPPFQPFLQTLADALGLRATAPAMTEPANAATHPPELNPGLLSESAGEREPRAQRVVECAQALGLDQHLPAYLRLLSLSHPDFALADQGEVLRSSLLSALTASLLARAGRAPLLIIVEDWHWADDASCQAFVHMARATANHRVMAVLTYRTDALAPERQKLAAEEIALRAFSPADTEQLLRALLAESEPPAALLRYLHRVTDGNPLFIEQECRALQESQTLVRHAGGYALARDLDASEMPSSIGAVLRARIDRLSADDKETLKLAAVIDEEFSARLLSTLVPAELPLLPALQRLVAQGLLLQSVGADEFRFKHALVRDVAYEMLPLRRRRELHARLGAAIAAEAGAAPEASYEALAQHFALGGCSAEALRYAELAGDKAARTEALTQAARQYQRALEALPALEATSEHLRCCVEITLKLAVVGVHNPTRAQLELLTRAQKAAKTLGAAREQARSLYWMAWIEHGLGNQASAIAYNQQCLAMPEVVADPALRRQVCANIGTSLVMTTDYEGAMRAFALVGDSLPAPSRKSMAPAPEGPALGFGRGGYGYALGHLSLLLADRGEFATAVSTCQRGFSAVQSAGQLVLEGALLTQRGIIALFQGDFATCRSVAAQVLQIAERVDGRFQQHMALTLRGYARFHSGEPAPGQSDLRQAAVYLEHNQIRLMLSFNLACLAEALCLQGEWQAALVEADKALARAACEDALGAVMAQRARALARYRLTSDVALAMQDMQAADAMAEAKQSPRELGLNQLQLARMLIDAGRLDEARSQAHASWSTFTRLGMPFYVEQAAQELSKNGS